MYVCKYVIYLYLYRIKTFIKLFYVQKSMKTNQTFTIDVDIAERLKGLDNQSNTINTLLKEYFEIRGDKSSILEEKEAVLSNLKKKTSNFLKTLRLLKSSIHSGLIILLKDGCRLVWGSHQKQK